MKLTSLDFLNIAIAVFTLGSLLTGMLSGFYSSVVMVLIIVWFVYYRIPWAHKKWKTELISDSVIDFHAYSKLLHAAIVYSLVILIVTSLLAGFITKSGPKVLANHTAEFVWANTSWGTTSISSSNVPNELKKVKKEDQPYAIIIEKNSLKAMPLHKILSQIASTYSSTFVELGSVLFLLIFVIGIVLYPTEMLANARNNKEVGKQ